MAITLDGSNLTTNGVINRGTAVTTTSGTAVNFTGIPIGASRITIMLNGVSFSGTSNGIIQIGAGSVEATGYASGLGAVGSAGASGAVGPTTVGFVFGLTTATNLYYGNITLTLVGSNLWVYSLSGYVNAAGTPFGLVGGGSKTLSGTLDRVRITAANGTDTFDAGSINILYE